MRRSYAGCASIATSASLAALRPCFERGWLAQQLANEANGRPYGTAHNPAGVIIKTVLPELALQEPKHLRSEHIRLADAQQRAKLRGQEPPTSLPPTPRCPAGHPIAADGSCCGASHTSVATA